LAAPLAAFTPFQAYSSDFQLVFNCFIDAAHIEKSELQAVAPATLANWSYTKTIPQGPARSDRSGAVMHRSQRDFFPSPAEANRLTSAYSRKFMQAD
jgi:hypothetical protein